MTRINTNIASLRAVNNLADNNRMLGKSLERLSTGLKINRASDGPAALIISERLKGQVASLKQAVETSDRANQMVSTAESALSEVSSLLITMQDLIIEASNDGALSIEEVLANQFQVDSAIETITRIASVTSYAGTPLLNGNFDYVVSGMSRSTVADFGIHGAQITNGVSNIAVEVTVTSNAERAILSVTSASVTTSTLSGLNLLVTGNLGSELINFGVQANTSAIANAVNSLSYATGVNATISGVNLFFQSTEYGKDQFVQIHDVTKGNIGSELIYTRDEGVDIEASINGTKAASRGLSISTNTFELNTFMKLSANFFTTNAVVAGVSASTTFYVTGGGATFQLGDDANIRDQEFIGIQRMTADNLGDRTIGFLSDIVTGGLADLSTNPEVAHKIVQSAIDDVTSLRARLGAFVSNTLDTNTNSLNDAILSLESSLSRIVDTDFAAATAEFTKNQILVQAGTSILAQANVTQQNVLQLLQ